MTNHSTTEAIRFQWPDHPQLKFSPQVGHLQSNSSKDMSLTFKSDQPKQLQESPVLCKVTKITFNKPPDQVNTAVYKYLFNIYDMKSLFRGKKIHQHF